MKKLTFKEEAEAMFDVFIKALQGKFPDNKMHFSIIVTREKELDENGNAEMASQSHGRPLELAYGINQYLKAEDAVYKNFLYLKLHGE